MAIAAPQRPVQIPPVARPALRALQWVLAIVWLLLGQLVLAPWAQAQPTGAGFEHNSTGFVLDMRHQTARCESCHIKGQFKGTPRDCASCHGWNNPRSTKVQSSTHIRTRANCESCHSPFLTRFEDVKFSHVNVQASTCQSCHSGNNPKIKTNPTNTLHTNALNAGMSCGSCHSTLSFTKIGVASNHIPVAASATCDACHNVMDFTQMPSVTAIHANAPSSGANCAQCHSSANAAAFSSAHMVPAIARPPANHIPMGSASCESCHVGSNSSITLPVVNGASFANSAFNHAGTTAACATCHGSSVTSGTFFGVTPKTWVGLTPGHVPTTLSCDTCHVNSVPSGLVPASGPTGGQSTFAGGQFSHSGITSGCDTCHGASVSSSAFFGTTLKTTASLNPPHLPTTASCTTCHGTPSSLVPATGATSGTTFAGAQFSHSGISSGCATCHGPTVTNLSFYGVTGIVVMPPSNVAGPNAHLPTSTTCENCHLGSTPTTPMSVTTARSVPNSGFKTPAPTSTMIHGGTSSGCNVCHDVPSGSAWMGMDQYPMTVSAGEYRGFNVRPNGTGPETYKANDNAHPSSGDCSLCHGNTSYFSGPSAPANHIPYNGSAGCGSCHTAFGTAPTVSNIHNWIQSKTTNCAQCHSSANAALYASTTTLNPIVTPPDNHVGMGSLGCESCHMASGSSITGAQVVTGDRFANSAFSHTGLTASCSSCHGSGVTSGTFFGVTPKNIDSLTPGHVPTTAECTVCHTASTPAMLIGPSGATAGQTTFAGAQFSHAGISTGCVTCHGPNVTGSSFFGITSMIVMPPTSPAASTSHLPTSTTCENCHAGSKPSGLVAANASASIPGSAFATPAPTATMIHAGVSGSCNTCHDVAAGSAWLGMSQYPMTSTGSGATAQFRGFNVRPTSAAPVAFRAQDGAHPSTGDCSQCHGSMTSFSSPSLPTNHIPYKASAQCSDCHNPFGTSPTITAIHSNLQSSATNCVQCHSTTNAALYAATTTARPIVTPASVSNHVPMGSLGCESCHMGANSSITGATVVNGNTFAGSAFSHSGISSGCASCHGSSITNASFYGVTPRTINGLNPPHVPTTAACESCHVGSVPAMLIPATGATAGMTTFAGAQFSHSGISSGCATCHGSSIGSNSFYGISSIITVPQSAIPGPTAHIPTSASCETCHAGSTPSSLVAANASRSIPGTGFQLPVPTASMIHTGVNGSCASCHDTNFVWVGMSKYPITTSAPYTGFQTRPQASAGTFFVADASHPAGECSNCHSSFSNFNGPSAPANHIPYSASASCSACHGDFSAPPTVTKIHANLQSSNTNCAQCHSTANAARYNPAILYNAIVAPPAGHIPMGSAGCENCHVGANSSMASTPVTDGARFSGSLFTHTGATASCATCHGPTVTPSTFTGIFPKSIGSTSPMHVPTSAACDLCHVNSVPTGLVPAAGMSTFANAQFSHSGISSGCAACHGAGVTNSSFAGITNIVVLADYNQSAGSNAHIPAPNNATCEACHLASTPSGLVNANASGAATTGFATPAPDSTKVHAAVSGSCNTCHNTGMTWKGMVTYYPMVPSTKTANASYTGFHSRPTNGGATNAINDAGHASGDLATADCAQCHSSTAAWRGYSAPTGHIPYAASATCGSCHTSFSAAPNDKALIHANIQSTTSNCAQCHSSANAALYAATTTAYPIKTPAANHVPMGNLGCENCHVAGNTTNFTSFQNGSFSHSGITTGCSACHGINVDGSTFEGLTSIIATGTLSPAPHIPVSNSISCEVCHTNSIPSGLVSATPANTAGFSGAKFTHSGITSGCSTCHGLASGGTAYAGLPINSIVRMPATSPQGSSAHMPTSQTCENCHLGSTPSTLIAGTSSAVPPNTGFRLPAPSASMIHSGITSSCGSCHTKDYQWVGVDKYPITVTAPYKGFQTRPYAAATTYSVQDAAHPANDDCSLCHSVSTFDVSVAPANHIPYKSGVACAACHTGGFGTAPAIGVVHANIQSSTTNCVQCHSTANAALYATTTTLRPIKTPASVPSATHIDMGTLSCETCHMGAGTGITSAVGDASTFAGGLFSHNGLTATCATCHGNSVTNSSFYGVTAIKVLSNYSASQGSTSHIPASNNASCETCHAGSKPAALVSVTATGSGFATPAPTSAMIHSGVSGSCATCHEKDFVWLGMGQYPITSSAPFKGFQTRPYGSATTFSVADAVHPGSGDCSSCHSGYTEWATNVKPSNHIPTANVGCNACHTTTNYSTVPARATTHANIPSTTSNCVQCHSAANAALYTAGGITIKAPGNTHVAMGNLSCEACHVGSNSSIASTVLNNSTFANSAFSHAAVNGNCASCHNGQTFEGSMTPVSMTGSASVNSASAHIPNPAGLDCGACHQTVPSGLAKIGDTSATFFTNSKYSHAGITSGCASCHGSAVTGTSFKGISQIVVLSNYNAASGSSSHIPAPNNANCENCHLASTPAGLISPNATTGAVNWGGASGFFSPAPTGAQIHASIASVSCSTCHESTRTWTGMSKYPRSPSVLTANATYTGFHTRPVAGGGGYSITDANHPTTGDCSQCHGSTTSFSVSAMPSNHIPIGASASCTACHTNITATDRNFSQMPTVTNIHANGPAPTTSNCAQCHSTANAAFYAIPSAGFTITGPGNNHIPFGSTGCEVCHVGASSSLQLPVTTGKHFSGSQFSHQGITTGCAACHGSSVTMTSFRGITSIVTLPNYNQSSGAGSHIPAPNNGTCEACHLATTPSGLIAANATGSATSWGGASGFYSPAPTGAQVHSGTPTNCVACHESGMSWTGMAAKYPRTPTTMTLNANYTGFHTRPNSAGSGFSVQDSGHPTTGDCDLCHVGTTAFTGVGKPNGHMPTTPTGITSCAICHPTAGDYRTSTLASPPTALHGSISTGFVKYTAATVGNKTCATCHAVGTGGTSGTAPFVECTQSSQASCTQPLPQTYQPKTVAGVSTRTHLPIKTLDCNGCHAGSFTSFAGVNMKSGGNAGSMHTNATLAGLKCLDCHEDGMATMWDTGGITLLTRIPNKHTTASRKAPNDCSNCHSFNGGFRAAVRPVMRQALVSSEVGRFKPGMGGNGGLPTRGAMGNSFDHKGVEIGKCKTCHDGKVASGMPARHLMVTSSCDTCHRTSAWKPAQFSHAGVSPNTCLACHNGLGATAKPNGHFMTARSCDNCHKTTTWQPVTYTHLSPSYRPGADPSCVSCHVTNSEVIPRQMRALTRVKPVVGP